MDADTLARFFEWVDGCRERGALRVRLHDGTEIWLDPSHSDTPVYTPQPAPAPHLGPPETLPPGSDGNTIQRTDDIAAELDAVLFGKPLG